jgi:organic radical activating enzyme
MSCYFCQNTFYTEKLPRFERTSGFEWVSWLNRMYNCHHLDINGGEPMFYNDIVYLINNLENFNIVMFTNMPHEKLHLFHEMNTKTNNITLNVSYHPLEEKRSLTQFVNDFKTLPKRLRPTVHVIDIPEISYKNIRAAFATRGVYIESLSSIVPTQYNRITENFQTCMCKSDMDSIAPDLTVFPCSALMFRNIGGVHISEYTFTNSHIRCDYYGLCGPCLTMKDVVDIK